MPKCLVKDHLFNKKNSNMKNTNTSEASNGGSGGPCPLGKASAASLPCRGQKKKSGPIAAAMGNAFKSVRPKLEPSAAVCQ